MSDCRRSGLVLLGLGWLIGASSLPASPPVFPGLDRISGLEPAVHGWVLMGELQCLSCHEAAARPAWVQFKPGPDLSEAGRRLQPGYLREHLLAPQALKPGTTMPDPLRHLPPATRDQVATALMHFLLPTPDPQAQPEVTEASSVERGRELYHSIGCVACHAPEEGLADSVPLGWPARKYTPAGLTTFLENPLAVRSGGRMPDFQLSHFEAADLAAFLLRDAAAEAEVTTVPQPELVQQGRTHFVTYGCANCHAMDEVIPSNRAKPLDQLDPARGCLSDGTGPWPYYELTDRQRSALRAAVAQQNPVLEPEGQIQATLAAFNCLACHTRHEMGGVSEARESWFGTEDPNLGDQGRLPPSLTGVGAKLRPDWIRSVLVEGARVRPYMKTRMPRFGESNLTRLVPLLGSTDRLEPMDPLPTLEEREAANIGRELAGTKGLSCITCHAFKGQRSATMGALDLTEMGRRLNPEWFHQYLLNPQQFSPSTIMPAFWPGGQSQLPEVLNGDTHRQIAALWTWLREGYGASDPAGLTREPMRIAVTEEARLLRRSYGGVGKRGLAVGYPNQVNLLFNVEQFCLAKIWKGDFLDPAGVWTSQGHGTARPAGERPIDLGQSPELALLNSPHDAWPVTTGRPESYQFLGYRLDARQRPILRYRVGTVQVEDHAQEQAGPSTSAPHHLRRTLTFRTTAAPVSLVFRVIHGQPLRATSAQTFVAGDHLTVQLDPNSQGIVLDTGSGPELRVPIQFNGESSSLVLDYHW